MKAPITFAGVIPLILCCHLILNLREGYHQPSTTTTTQDVELSKFSSGLHDPHVNRGLDSMGHPRIFSGKRLVAPQFRPFILFLIAITSPGSDE